MCSHSDPPLTLSPHPPADHSSRLDRMQSEAAGETPARVAPGSVKRSRPKFYLQ